MWNRLNAYARFVKVEHTLFSLPLLFSGAILAGGAWPDARLTGLILLAGFGARTAAFALNRLIDWRFDARNPRTAGRELPAGRMSVREAWGVGLAGALVYVWASWRIAPICFYLSPVPLAVFAVYPYLKRFTAMAHFGVGLADAFAPLGGWLAVRQSFENAGPALGLGLFTFLWVSGFDIIYATLDEAFDRREGLHSLPARIGRDRALRGAAFLHIAGFMVLIGLYMGSLRTGIALASLTGIGALLFLQHRWAHDVDLAFFRLNAVMGFGILGFVAAGLGGGG